MCVCVFVCLAERERCTFGWMQERWVRRVINKFERERECVYESERERERGESAREKGEGSKM